MASIKRASSVVLLAALVLPINAAERAQLYGLWGTETQCSRGLITLTGSKRAAPFEITTDWLGHGEVWCRLSWFTVVESENNVFASARALCGEDTVQNFRVSFNLEGEELTIGWNDLLFNGPFMRCIVDKH